MDFLHITSRDNAIIKQINALRSSAKTRRQEGLFVLEGLRISSDACDNGVGISVLAVSERGFSKYKNEILRIKEKAEKCCLLSDSVFKKISETENPQGVITVCRIPLKNKKISPKKRYIGLENLQDPANLGAVARTAEALGTGGIVLTSNGCDPYSPKALRASMGTLLRMPLYFTNDIIGFAGENGLRTVACVVTPDADDIKDFSFADGDLLLIGNEGNGLTESTKDGADARITVKMHGRVESLNAAAAAAIALWEMCG